MASTCLLRKNWSVNDIEDGLLFLPDFLESPFAGLLLNVTSPSSTDFRRLWSSFCQKRNLNRGLDDLVAASSSSAAAAATGDGDAIDEAPDDEDPELVPPDAAVVTGILSLHCETLLFKHTVYIGCLFGPVESQQRRGAVHRDRDLDSHTLISLGWKLHFCFSWKRHRPHSVTL